MLRYNAMLSRKSYNFMFLTLFTTIDALPIYRLDRMSVDLDFEVDHPVSETFLNELKQEIEAYFLSTYNADSTLLFIKKSGTRGLRLNFNIGDQLGVNHPSKQVHVKIDLNHFISSKTVIERRPINHDQLSFVIKTYNMPTLMASKLAAIFLRGRRGVGQAVYEEKGRDIYDLLWYMTKEVMPNLDYLIAKGVDVKDPRVLFDKLTLKMNNVADANLKHDLTPLFVNQNFIENWLKNWRESYLSLLGGYKINTVTELNSVGLTWDSNSEILGFEYYYSTEEKNLILIKYRLDDSWINLKNGQLTMPIDENVVRHMSDEARPLTGKAVMKQKQYASLFYKKTEKYLQKTNRIILGDRIITKLIRMTADNFNYKEQIVLDPSALRSCDLDDLLK